METYGSREVEYLDAGPASFVGLINELCDLCGYKASAITTYEGEMLYSNAAGLPNNRDLSVLIEGYNRLFGHACGLSEKSGFVCCTEMVVKSGRDMVVIRCSGKDCLVGIRLLVLVEDQGNLAITQRRLGNLLPRLMKCLTWEPDNLVPLYLRESAGLQGSEKILRDN